MKTILSVILCCIFTIFSFPLLWGTVLANQEINDNSDYNDSEMWINFWNNCLTGMWKWCFDYEKMIWIHNEQNQKITTKSIAQDILLSATYMVWTVLTIVIIACGIWYILAARWWKDPNKYKDWLIYAAIWALLVRFAYAIVRLIQYVAKW